MKTLAVILALLITTSAVAYDGFHWVETWKDRLYDAVDTENEWRVC